MPLSIEDESEFATEFIMTALAAIAGKVTGRGQCTCDIDLWAKATGEMFCAYLTRGMLRSGAGQNSW